ncbi:hypothetical protein NDU88_003382 [Pleurodeles waltl]|uniref:Uncharacterized protein n=1 Tax=Pleurodeles waltl TaxID=8319 RepID=A0AAV7TND8_PLEWA|nr:hypothetical protein NDU88_003382 [Pleurodeles waltl]
MQRDKLAARRVAIMLSENDRGAERLPSPVTKRGEQVAEKATGVRKNPETQDQVSGGGAWLERRSRRGLAEAKRGLVIPV